MAGLTQDEREAHACCVKPRLCRDEHFHQRDVERIIAARVAEHEAREARVRALADQWERGIAALLPAAGSFKQADKLDGSLATLIGASNDLKRALDGGE